MEFHTRYIQLRKIYQVFTEISLDYFVWSKAMWRVSLVIKEHPDKSHEGINILLMGYLNLLPME
jgi:hypothetical protein